MRIDDGFWKWWIIVEMISKESYFRWNVFLVVFLFDVWKVCCVSIVNIGIGRENWWINLLIFIGEGKVSC